MRSHPIEDPDLPPGSARWFTAIGLIEGAIWWWAHPFASRGPIEMSNWAACAVFGATGAALSVRFAWTGRHGRRLASIAVILALLLVGVTAWVWNQLPEPNEPWGGDHMRTSWWVVGAAAFLYLVGPFAQAFQRSGEPRLDYRSIFDHSWNNLFVGGIALAFVGTLWALLGIWGALFRIIGVTAFAELFSAMGFAYLFSFAAFGYGLHLGRSSTAVIRALRRITFALARTILPVVSGVMLLFLLSLPATGLGPLWASGQTTPLILALLALFIVPLNAVFEDGTSEVPYQRGLRWIVRAAAFALPAFAAVSLYSLALRVGQHGLSPARVFALIFAGIVALYSIGYAYAAVGSRSGWMSALRPVNLAGAICAGLIALLVQLPPLDPMRLSTRNQVARLLSGKVAPDRFDFDALRRFGRYGSQAIEQLSALDAQPGAESIRAALTRARRGGRIDSEWIRIAPAGVSIDSDVLATLRDRNRWLLDGCSRETCLLIAADLDGDGLRDYCVLNSRRTRSECSGERGEWTGRGLTYLGSGSFPDLESVAGALETEPPALGPSRRIQVLDLGTGELFLTPK